MRTEVREVFHKGAQAVVEWRDYDGDVHRSIFPESALISENNKIFVEEFEEGQPYGIDWMDYIPSEIYREVVAAKLRNKGIWTLEDLQQKPAVVTSVFAELTSVILQHFRESVLRQGKEDQ